MGWQGHGQVDPTGAHRLVFFLPAAKPLVLERPKLLLWWWWGDRIEWVVYLIAPHYKFSSGWDPILQFIQPNFVTINSLWGGIRLSQIRFLFGVGSSANISDFLKRSLSPWVYFFLKLYCYSRRSLNKVCSCLVKELFQKTDFAWRPHAFIALGGFKKVIIITRPGLPLCLYTLLQEGT